MPFDIILLCLRVLCRLVCIVGVLRGGRVRGWIPLRGSALCNMRTEEISTGTEGLKTIPYFCPIWCLKGATCRRAIKREEIIGQPEKNGAFIILVCKFYVLPAEGGCVTAVCLSACLLTKCTGQKTKTTKLVSYRNECHLLFNRFQPSCYNMSVLRSFSGTQTGKKVDCFITVMYFKYHFSVPLNTITSLLSTICLCIHYESVWFKHLWYGPNLWTETGCPVVSRTLDEGFL